MAKVVGAIAGTLSHQASRKGGPGPSREQVLASIETVAAGPAKRKIQRAQQADRQRRADAVKAMQPRYALAWASAALLLTVAGIVLLLPERILDVFDHTRETFSGEAYYTREVGDASFVVAAVMIAAGAIIHWWLEAHRPRSLPYPVKIYIPYLLFGIPAASATAARWLDYFDVGKPQWLGTLANYPLPALAGPVAAAGLLSFAVLLVFSWRSPRAAATMAPGGEEARELDRQFRADVRAAIYDDEHVHTGAYRAQALEGVRLLHADGLISDADALWMLQEIAPESAPDTD